MVNLENGVKKSELLSHHDFQKMIALAWVNEEYYLAKYGAKKHRNKRRQNEVTDDSHDSPAMLTRRKRSKVSPTPTTGGSNTAISHFTISVMDCDIIAPHITDKSLNPFHGKLAKRLNRDMDHFPCQKKSRHAKCGLHRWATGKEVYSDLFCCGTCGVHLCQTCWQTFHRVTDIVSNKEVIFPEIKNADETPGRKKSTSKKSKKSNSKKSTKRW